MKRKVSLYLRDVVENMWDAEEFVRDMPREHFENDKKTIYAVLRAVEVIGEATKHVPAGIRERYPAIPWKEMAGMRDKLIHDYIGVDVEIVWLAVKERIPSIRPLIEQVLREVERQEA